MDNKGEIGEEMTSIRSEQICNFYTKIIQTSCTLQFKIKGKKSHIREILNLLTRGGPFCQISGNIKERFPAWLILYALCHKKTENIFLEIKC